MRVSVGFPLGIHQASHRASLEHLLQQSRVDVLSRHEHRHEVKTGKASAAEFLDHQLMFGHPRKRFVFMLAEYTLLS